MCQCKQLPSFLGVLLCVIVCFRFLACLLDCLLVYWLPKMMCQGKPLASLVCCCCVCFCIVWFLDWLIDCLWVYWFPTKCCAKTNHGPVYVVRCCVWLCLFLFSFLFFCIIDWLIVFGFIGYKQFAVPSQTISWVK